MIEMGDSGFQGACCDGVEGARPPSPRQRGRWRRSRRMGCGKQRAVGAGVASTVRASLLALAPRPAPHPSAFGRPLPRQSCGSSFAPLDLCTSARAKAGIRSRRARPSAVRSRPGIAPQPFEKHQIQSGFFSTSATCHGPRRWRRHPGARRPEASVDRFALLAMTAAGDNSAPGSSAASSPGKSAATP